MKLLKLTLIFFGVLYALMSYGQNTFTVNTTDWVDDGLCNSAHCSLREAIRISNLDAAITNIEFNIIGTAPFIISPTTDMYLTEEGTTIDGTTQPGYTLGDIVIDGTNAPLTGPVIWASNTQIYGLFIRNFPGNGIPISPPNGVGNIENIVIGDDSKENIISGNGDVLSGNRAAGIIVFPNTNNVNIQHNFISGNSWNGIEVWYNTQYIEIQHNIIGIDEVNNSSGNIRSGIFIWDTKNTSIFNNTIAHNYRGIWCEDNDTGFDYVGILNNSIFCNTEKAIDYIAVDYLPPPEFNVLSPSSISGTAIPNSYIQIFSDDNTICSSNGDCQGKFFIGETIADSNGDWILNGLFNNGISILATASIANSQGYKHTSDFSCCQIIDGVNTLNTTKVYVTNTNDSGTGSLRAAIDSVNCFNVDTIHFNILGNTPHYIEINSLLPSIIKNNVVIDATSQPNYTLRDIRLTGSSGIGVYRGLTIDADSCEVYGIEITQFLDIGVEITRNARGIKIGDSIRQNYINANSTGVRIYGQADISNNIFNSNTRGVVIEEMNNTFIDRNEFYCNTTGISCQVSICSITPIITSINENDNLTGYASPNAYIQIYQDNLCNGSNCQGSTYLGSTISNASGDWSFNVSTPLQLGDKLVITSTENSKNTSEFSCFEVKEDFCVFARDIPINSDPCDNNGVQIDFKDLNPSSQIHSLACDGGLPPNNLVDAWYKITVPPTGNCLVRTNGDNTIAPVLEVFTGDCNTLTQVQCGAIDTPPYAMVLSNYQPGTELYISIWDRNNAIVNSSSDAILSITAHELSSNSTEWQICDQSNNTFGNPTNLSQQDLLNYILEFDDNTPQDSVLAWQTDAVALGDSLVDECACGGRTLQLWGVDNLIDLEERRQSAKSRARVDTSNYNYIFEDIEFQVNDYSTGRQDKVDVDMDNEGDFAMVWVDSDRKHNYGRVYNSSGNPISSEIQISLTNKEQASASVAMKEDGSFIVVWHEKDITNPNTQNSVFLRHFDAEGTHQGVPVDISLAAANNISAATDTINKYGYGVLPQIDTDINGNYIVAWNIGFNIYFQLFDSSDNFIGTVQTVNDPNNSSFMSNVDVSMNDSGAFVIAWNGSGNGLDIWAKRFDNLGNPIGNTFKVNSIEGNDQAYPAIDLANDGTLTATWQSLGIGFFNEILWNQFDSNNTPVNAGDQLANTVLVEDQLTPDVIVFDNGDFVISWSSYHEHASTNSDFNIYARFYNNDGSAYDSQEFRVNTISSFSTDFEQSIPKLACNGENIIINAWVDRNGDTNYEGIFAQRYEVLSTGGAITDYYPIGTATPSTLLGQELVHPNIPYTPPASDAAQVRVAVIDTGIDENHPLLSNALWNNQEVNDGDNCVLGDVIGYDFINETGNLVDLPSDGHGTKVNGIVARDFDANVNLEVMNLKFHELQKGKVFDAVCAIYYAVDNGAEVLNLSWGFEASENPAVLRDALLYASDNDVLIVTTAGNTSKNNDIINKYPANLDIPNMIVVTSYTIDNQTGDIELSNYASYGATNVDIAAHGFVETSVVGGSLDLSAGTSLAAPAVTRTAATIKGLYPTLSAADIKDCILSTADVQAGLTGYVATNGCLNHAAALACAQAKHDMLCSAVDLYISTTQSIDSTYRSNEFIGSNATLSNTIDLEYLAADSILLDADFCVPLGAEFLADIEDCDPLNNFTGSENDVVFRIQEHSNQSGKIKAQFEAKAGESVTISFMDSNKKLLDEWQAAIPENGQFEKIIDVHRLPAGLYYIEYSNGDWLVEKAVQVE